MDGAYSIEVTIPGDYTFAFASVGNDNKSLAVHSALLGNPRRDEGCRVLLIEPT